jgi:hypothetical protein
MLYYRKSAELTMRVTVNDAAAKTLAAVRAIFLNG